MCHKLFGVFFIETSQCVVFTLSSMPGCPLRFVQLFAVVPQSQAANSLSEQLKWRQRQTDHGYTQVHVILDSRKLVSEKIPYSTWLHHQGWLRDDIKQ